MRRGFGGMVLGDDFLVLGCKDFFFLLVNKGMVFIDLFFVFL